MDILNSKDSYHCSFCITNDNCQYSDKICFIFSSDTRYKSGFTEKYFRYMGICSWKGMIVNEKFENRVIWQVRSVWYALIRPCLPV